VYTEEEKARILKVATINLERISRIRTRLDVILIQSYFQNEVTYNVLKVHQVASELSRAYRNLAYEIAQEVFKYL